MYFHTAQLVKDRRKKLVNLEFSTALFDYKRSISLLFSDHCVSIEHSEIIAVVARIRLFYSLYTEISILSVKRRYSRN